MIVQLRVFPLNNDFIYAFLPFTSFTNVGKLTKEILFSRTRRLIFLLLERTVKAVKGKKGKKVFLFCRMFPYCQPVSRYHKYTGYHPRNRVNIEQYVVSSPYR